MPGRRERLRSTFDGTASLYDEVRPGYPERLFDDVASLSGIPEGGRILEVGCGTGQATLPLARRGYGILCVELGKSLAARARRNLAAYSRVEVLTADFEEDPLPKGAFDLLVSATAFHWLDPAVAYPKAARSLRSGGAIALFWNEHVATDADGGFFAEAQEVYAREAPEIWDENHTGPPPVGELPDRGEGIAHSGLFGPVVRRTYLWEQAYDLEGYLRVLDTYSGHIALAEETRARLYGGISRLIQDEHGGRVVKGYATSLYLARKE